MTRKCPNCNTINNDDAKFCKSCGESFHNDAFSHDGTKDNGNIFSNEKGNNRNLIIICATIILCAIIIAGALMALGGNSSNGNANIISKNNDTIDNSNKGTEDIGNRYENFSTSEWDQSSYTLDDIYTAHTPEDVKKKMFNQADSNGDGILTGDEIKEMDYLLKHSDYTWNGPGIYIHDGYISTGSAKSDKTYCHVNVGSGYAGENVKISVLYSRDGTNLNKGNIVPKTVDSDGYVSVASAEAFKKYPDEAFITIYDSDGSTIDTKTVYLDPTSGTQYF